MVIKELYLEHFGKFHHKHIKLSQGMNIIYGGNEAGKSTIYRFIQCMLFGVERLRGKGAANDEYTRFKPWDNGYGYEGIMIIEHQGITYRLYRNFMKEHPEFNVYNHQTGEEIILPDGQISSLIPGLTAANFRNTISIAQQTQGIEDNFATAMQSYLVNMSLARDEQIDIKKALEFLQEEERKVKDAKPVDELKKIRAQIEESERAVSEVQKHEALSAQYQKEIQMIKQQIDQNKRTILEITKKEQFERAEGIHLIEQRQKLLKELKMQEQQAQQKQKKSKGIFGQKSFFCFLVLTICAAMSMLIQLVWQIDSIILKVLTGVFFVCAFGAFLKTSFKRPVDEIDFHAYKMQLLDIQRKLKPYIEKYGNRMDQDGSEVQLQQRLEKLQEEKQKLEKQLHESQWEIKRLLKMQTENEQLQLSYEKLRQKNLELKKNLEAIEVSKMLIKNLAGQMNQQFGMTMNEQIQQIFEQVSGTNGRRMILDSKLNIYIDDAKQPMPLNRLSTATKDQIYYALRFCMGSFLFSGQKMPVILDDAFVYYDDARLERMLAWIEEEKIPQTILFTCHRRESKILDTLYMPYHCIELQDDV